MSVVAGVEPEEAHTRNTANKSPGWNHFTTMKLDEYTNARE
jgi:hypothetical protein